MNDGKLTIDLSGVGNDIPTKLGKSRPTLTASTKRYGIGCSIGRRRNA